MHGHMDVKCYIMFVKLYYESISVNDGRRYSPRNTLVGPTCSTSQR